MRFFVKLAASTVGVLCTTATAYLFVDEKKRYGVVFAATSVPSSPNVDVKNVQQGSISSPVRSTEPWNWNWDG